MLPGRNNILARMLQFLFSLRDCKQCIIIRVVFGESYRFLKISKRTTLLAHVLPEVRAKGSVHMREWRILPDLSSLQLFFLVLLIVTKYITAATVQDL